MGKVYNEVAVGVSSQSSHSLQLTDDTVVAPRLEDDPGDFPIPRIVIKEKPIASNPNLLTSLVAGAAAGIVVDVSLFPLDTLKTRLQSKDGFKNTGGFKGVYKGIVPVLLGSAPISALFFATYNTLVNKMKTEKNTKWEPIIHVLAASAAEVVGASIRVPIEVVKQRRQVSSQYTKSMDIVRLIMQKEGVLGMYRGFLSTITREVPFAAIQFPLWELLKKKLARYTESDISALQTACCGAVAGGIAAAMTTPMDVVKTRIMLADVETVAKYKKLRNYHFLKDIVQQRGILGLFAGIVPRVLWITLGGFIYFGVYEKIKATCEITNITLSKHEVYMQQIAKLRREEREMEIQSQVAPSYADASQVDSRDQRNHRSNDYEPYET